MSAPVQKPRAQALIRWIIFGMSILTFIFACVSVGHCSFITIDYNYDYNYGSVGYGLFSYEYNGGCERYDSDREFAASEKAARAFGALLMISMPCVLVTTVISTFFLGNGMIGRATWMSTRILVLVSIVCQSLTFCFVEKFEDASLGAAGGIAVLNLILLVALSVLTWLVPPREESIIKQCKNSDKHVMPQPGKTDVHIIPPPPKPDANTPTQPIRYPDQAPQPPNTGYAPATQMATEEDID